MTADQEDFVRFYWREFTGSTRTVLRERDHLHFKLLER